MKGIRLVSAFGESRDLVFSPSRSNLGLVSSRLTGFVRNREIYNLSMVSGPVLLKIKGTSWIFMKKLDFVESINQRKTKKWNEIGQIWVSGALNDTKTIGKAGADIFEFRT